MLNKTINGYTIKRKLGEGGMAEVWYAENGIGKPAAVKMLKIKFCADETVIERFQNEAKVMVRLSHPNIRQVYDYAMLEGRPCIIMEYLEGNDLKNRMVRSEKFTSGQLSQWWSQLSDALLYTHSQDVIHRDIKPSNIFIDKYGNVKLLDFGIAKIEESGGHTQTGVTMGTRIYMSPEQVRDPKRVKAATDSYSLAVTFVHLLTGKAPYDTTTSSDFDIQLSIVSQPLDLSELPRNWQEFLTPYLEKDAGKRPELREFSEHSAATFDDENDHTLIESTISSPKPETKPSSDIHNGNRHLKTRLWIINGLLAATIAMSITLFYFFPFTIFTGWCLVLLLAIAFITINIFFFNNSVTKKTKWTVGICSVVLLATQIAFAIEIGAFGEYPPYDMLRMPIIPIALGMEGIAFAALFCRNEWLKWITVALSIIVLEFFFRRFYYYYFFIPLLFLIGIVGVVLFVMIFCIKKFEPKH